MKRENNLIEKIADPDNLRLAFWKARKAKDWKMEVAEYRKNLDERLLTLRSQLLSGKLQIGDHHYFTIYDPKERNICAASFHERILHHALINVCHPNFEKFQTEHSYASRLGKGTFAAIEQASKYQKKFRWFLKLDVRKYFDSVDHNVLKSLLERRFKDKSVLHVLYGIIDSYSVSDVKGLPIGNLTSQYFANHYLAIGDHYIKEKLHAPAYVRYMDDMVIWADDKTQLIRIGKGFQDFIETELLLKLKPFCLNSTAKGLPFCGFLIYPQKTLLNRNSKQRFKTKLNKFANKLNAHEWTQKEYQSHVLPLIAFVKHADTFHLRQRYNELNETG